MSVIHPPEFAQKILSRSISPHLRSGAMGDFEQIFSEMAETNGLRAATAWYWREVIRSLPFFIFDSVYWAFVMLKNYFHVAYRNLQKNKSSSVVNILGLSLAVATRHHLVPLHRAAVHYGCLPRERREHLPRREPHCAWGGCPVAGRHADAVGSGDGGGDTTGSGVRFGSSARSPRSGRAKTRFGSWSGMSIPTSWMLFRSSSGWATRLRLWVSRMS